MKRDRAIRGAAMLASVAWMAVIFGLSAIPASAMPPGEYSTFAHFGVYAVLGALLLLAMPDRGRTWTSIAAAVAIASLYGISDEFHQSFVPGRMPDVADWMVDTVGALTAAVLVTITRRAASRRQ